MERLDQPTKVKLIMAVGGLTSPIGILEVLMKRFPEDRAMQMLAADALVAMRMLADYITKRVDS